MAISLVQGSIAPRSSVRTARVLKPVGSLRTVDFRATGEYASYLRALGFEDVHVRRLKAVLH